MAGDSVMLSMPEQWDIVDHMNAWHGWQVGQPTTPEQEAALARSHRELHHSGVMVHVHTHRGLSHL